MAPPVMRRPNPAEKYGLVLISSITEPMIPFWTSSLMNWDKRRLGLGLGLGLGVREGQGVRAKVFLFAATCL